MREGIFIGFSIITILFALGVVFSKNAIFSAFNLVLCFFSLAGVYVLWGAMFIATVQVLIYTGAIVVLFLFVIMLIDLVRATPSTSPGWLNMLVAGGASWSFALLLLRALNQSKIFTVDPSQVQSQNLKFIAKLLFGEYLWPFEILSFFLLALILAVYVLSRPDIKPELTSKAS
jgi:NADH-quinone oxidoreductase subunit J